MTTKPYEKFLCLILLSIISIPAFSQKAPIKYGKIDLADLEMTSYPLDTSAVAAILCDYGYFSSTTYNFVRVLRIKILKKEGTSWGDKIFPTSAKTDVKGITYNLENGEVVETKLKSESVFQERVTDDLYRIRVAMPNVRVGSVIDLQFAYPWLPGEWNFQDVIPVKWSELNIEESSYINFRKTYFGFLPLAESTPTRWVAKNMPAFKEEPYTTNASNYLTKYKIEVLNISIPPSSSSNGYYKEYSTSWGAVNNQLMQAEHFGMTMRSCMFLNDKVKEIELNSSGSMEKVMMAHEFVKSQVKWNESEALFTSSDNLSTPYSERIGNSADINLILIQMLKKLDFKVLPVALSTRSNGFLSPVYPSLDQLNYVVAYVWIDDKPYFVDATDEFLPVGMLPVRCINLKGRIIDESESDWVDLIPVKKDKKVVQAELTVGQDLVMNGKLSRRSYDYAALKIRNDYSMANSEEDFYMGIEADYPGLSIVKAEVTNIDSSYLPVNESYDVKIKNKVSVAGDLLYIYPMLFEQITENPFKSEERNYPVDFVYPSEKTYILKITLPEGSQIVELPKTQVFKLQDNSLSVQYQVNNIGNDVHLTYKINQTKPYYSTEEYADLRAFYSELVKKHAEPIIIKML